MLLFTSSCTKSDMLEKRIRDGGGGGEGVRWDQVEEARSKEWETRRKREQLKEAKSKECGGTRRKSRRF
jgi:hypothetical protein